MGKHFNQRRNHDITLAAFQRMDFKRLLLETAIWLRDYYNIPVRNDGDLNQDYDSGRGKITDQRDVQVVTSVGYRT